MWKNRLFFVLILVLFSQPVFSEGQMTQEDYLLWARAISKGVRSICEPISFSEVPIPFFSARKFAREWKPKEGVVPFGKIIVYFTFTHPPYKIRNYLDTKKIPSQFIRAVLNYRKAIRNNLSTVFDEEGKDWLGNGYYFVFFSPNVVLGYLEYFQILTFNLLLANNDLRFGKEAMALLNYIKEPKGSLNNDEARWHYYSQLSGARMERLIEYYLKKCKTGLK